MRKFAEFVLKFRIIIILLTVGVTFFLGYHLKDIKINSDILSYLPQNDPLVVLFNEVGDKFGGNSLAVVALEKEDIFNYETLNRVNQITQKFKNMDEISQVMSLTDILDIKKIEGGLEVGKLIDKDDIPQDFEKIKKIKEYTLSKDMYRGSLVSADSKITVIIARLKEDIDKIAVAQQMKKIVQNTSGKEKIYYGGIPFQMIFLTDIIQADLIKLTPMVVILVMLILYFSFKSLRGIFLPLSCVLMSTIWTVGIMSLLKIPLTIASDAVPVLLVAIGSAYGIHMLSKYNEDICKGDDKIQGIKDALSEVGIPILLAGITTLIGFLAFLSSPLGLIKDFGLFTADGVFFAMIVSVTFLPAVLSLLKVRKIKLNHQGVEDGWTTRIMDKLGKFVLRKEKLIVGGCAVLMIISFLVVPHLNRNINMIDYFKKNSEIRQAEEMMENKLGGSIPIQLLVNGDLKDPFVLKEMVKLEKFLDAQPHVNDPQSIADLICEMNWVMNGHSTIPETKEEVANLWFFIEGQEVLDQLINSEATEGLIQAKMGTVETKEMDVLVKAVNNYLEEKLNIDSVKIKISLASDKLAEELKKQRVEQILSKIKWDIQKRPPISSKVGSKNVIIYDNLKKIITASILVEKKGFDKEFIKIIETKISNYFHSEEADIQIKSKQGITIIISGIAKKLQVNTPGEKDIIAILRKNVPEILYIEEPEILEYTASSIIAIINEEKRWVRVNQLMDELKPLFPRSLRGNEEFLKDLRDDIWEINEDWFALASSKYSKFSNDTNDPIGNKVKLTIAQTGMPIIYMDIDRKIIQSQVFSLSIAIFLVFILLAFRLKSLVGGLISISPIIFTILFNFTVMSIFNIPLDIVTVLISSVAVGIGIDYSIHFISRFKVEFAKGKSELEALDKTLETTGKAIIINALSVMMGFLVLVLGNIVPMQRFGYLIALTMIISALSSITLLPALILLTKAGFIGSFDRLTKNLISNVKGKIKRGMREGVKKITNSGS